MTYSNGSEAPEQSAPDPEENGEKFTAVSLDYWREMTQRQVERLQQKVKELEDEAQPLKQQINALSLALSATASGTAPKSASAAWTAKQKGQPATEQEKLLVAQLVRQGLDTTAIRARLLHVKPASVYNLVYAAQRRLKEGART